MMVDKLWFGTRFFYTLLIVLFVAFSAKAQPSIDTASQNKNLTANDTLKSQEEAVNGNKITKAAEFPGGHSALKQFVSSRVQYPEDIDFGLRDGKVVVKFTILKTGQVDPESIQVVKSIYYILDNEVVRVLKQMPKWEPAYEDGKPVNSSFTLPVVFVLE